MRYSTSMGSKWPHWTKRYWTHVEKRSPDECWLWTGSVISGTAKNGRNRYGRIMCDRTYVLAHRISYLIHKGPVPDGLLIMHSCDEPRCQNPQHLRVGTQLDNIRDCIAKGRANRAVGEAAGASVLTERDVLKIRSLYPGRSQQSIADRYGVKQTTISRIVLRQTWGHV